MNQRSLLSTHRSRSTDAERCRTCLVAIEAIEARCQRGADLVFPPDGFDRIAQREAAAFMWQLLRAADRLSRTANAADPMQYAAWHTARAVERTALGWDWPEDRGERAQRDTTHIQQLAFEAVA